MIHDVLAGLTGGATAEEISHVQQIVHDTTDEVHISTGGERSIHAVEHYS